MGKIVYPRGTKAVFTHNYLLNGVAASTGTTLLFTVKSTKYDTDVADTTTVLSKTISMSGATNIITINAADIADTIPPKDYYYDIKIIDSILGGPYLADSGTFTLTATPTNRLA